MLDQDLPVERPVLEVLPGVAIGEVRIGMTFAELKSALGEPDMQFGFRRTMNVRYTPAQLEVALITREDHRVEDDSVVVADEEM